MAPLTPSGRLVDVGLEILAMGGRVRLQVACAPEERDRARRDLGLVARRVERWVARLTRFEHGSELCALNADPGAAHTPVGPTLAAVLAWATEARRTTRGAVDVTLLEARLAAEAGTRWTPPVPAPGWRLRRTRVGRQARVEREGRVCFDLDGVAKGWIADRALAHLRGHPAALVDADGDIALAVDERTGWTIAVADPADPAAELLTFAPEFVGPMRIGVATSGIDVHHWGDDTERHHLIDPATGHPAVTDLRQCTVVATSAALAEAVAKAMVIRGSEVGAELAGRPGVLGAVLVRRSGELLVTEQALTWLV